MKIESVWCSPFRFTFVIISTFHRCVCVCLYSQWSAHHVHGSFFSLLLTVHSFFLSLVVIVIIVILHQLQHAFIDVRVCVFFVYCLFIQSGFFICSFRISSRIGRFVWMMGDDDAILIKTRAHTQREYAFQYMIAIASTVT